MLCTCRNYRTIRFQLSAPNIFGFADLSAWEMAEEVVHAQALLRLDPGHPTCFVCLPVDRLGSVLLHFGKALHLHGHVHAAGAACEHQSRTQCTQCRQHAHSLYFSASYAESSCRSQDVDAGRELHFQSSESNESEWSVSTHPITRKQQSPPSHHRKFLKLSPNLKTSKPQPPRPKPLQSHLAS